MANELQFSSIEINDASGGITDYPFEAPLNKFAELNNIIIDPNKKPIQRPGSDTYIPLHVDTALGVARFHGAGSITNTDLYTAAEDQVFYPLVGGWFNLVGVGGVAAFNQGAGSTTMRSAFSEWNGHLYATTSLFSLPIKIYKDGTLTPQVRTAGLPIFPNTYTATPTAVGVNSYIYYLVYKFTYSNGAVQFVNFSSPGIVQVLNSADPSVNQINLAAIPVLANAGGSSYDLTSITKEIYRTTSGGTVAYFVASISNATVVFVDNFADTTIQTNEVFYGSLGIQYYDPPPLAKFVHVMNGRAYYAYTQDSFGDHPTRVYQSIQDLPDAVPALFFTEVREPIKGISSHSNNVIVFGTSKIYRLDGYFDELGRNGIVYEEISTITGAVSHNSIVQTDIGVFFAGNSGFFFTDGYKVSKVSDSINERYKLLVSTVAKGEKIYGTYDPINLKIYWAVQNDVTTGENDSVYELDLRWGIRTDSCFTTWSNSTYFRPTVMFAMGTKLLRTDPRGYLFNHDPVFVNDPRIDVFKDFEDWGHKAIVYNIKTPHINFGFPQIRKWVVRALLTVKNVSNISIQVNSINDDSFTANPLRVIRFRSSIIWGDPNVIWGDPSIIWLYQGLIERWARFPAGGLRCSTKQVQITNADCIITQSDIVATATFDVATLVATIDNLLLGFPVDALDWRLELQPHPLTGSENYPIKLPIVAMINNGILAVGDTLLLPLNSTYFLISSSITDYYVWFDTGGGVDPAIPGRVGVHVVIPALATPQQVAVATAAALDGTGDFVSTVPVAGLFLAALAVIAPPLHPSSQGTTTFSFSNAQYIVTDPLNILPNYPAPQYDFHNINWYVTGIPKYEQISLQNLVLYYAPLTPSQRTFHNFQQDAGENTS